MWLVLRFPIQLCSTCLPGNAVRGFLQVDQLKMIVQDLEGQLRAQKVAHGQSLKEVQHARAAERGRSQDLLQQLQVGFWATYHTLTSENLTVPISIQIERHDAGTTSVSL